MLLQVHDELLFEVPEAEADATIETVRDVMERAAHPAVQLSVPLIVEAGEGRELGGGALAAGCRRLNDVPVRMRQTRTRTG